MSEIKISRMSSEHSSHGTCTLYVRSRYKTNDDFVHSPREKECRQQNIGLP